MMLTHYTIISQHFTLHVRNATQRVIFHYYSPHGLYAKVNGIPSFPFCNRVLHFEIDLNFFELDIPQLL
jgi:hypothetical protein